MSRSLIDIEDSFYEPLHRMQDELTHNFWDWPFTSIRATGHKSYPPSNLGHTDDKVIVYLFVPGLDLASIELNARHGLLTISGQRPIPKTEKGKYYANERFSGEFHRSISLPDYADPDQAEASYRDGILTVSLRRNEDALSPKKIEIK
ncbi:Hsp20/alpha crystallin family protein [Photobacterium sagamiensis]|uniref:Hsp20/alpha crystallin family protein n=1 Tax=Photobacterium sagamiensis TaxID=2910241 RepID=UPI003D0FDC2E